MAFYNVNGNEITSAYDVEGNLLNAVYDVEGNLISGTADPYIHGTVYPFSSMSKSDPDNVTSTSTKVKNATSSIAYTPTVEGNAVTPVEDYEQVTFTCSIPVSGQNFGIWMYVAPNSVPCYGGRTEHHNGIGRYRIKINNTWYNLEDVKAGWSFQLFNNASSFTTITSIIFCAINNLDHTANSTVVLDSVEVGYSLKKAHVMFNLDCVPPNFYDVGYPLFEQYGLKCTLDYHLSETSASVGADSGYYNSSIHSELTNKGYEFAVYSGWKEVENYGEAVPYYDDETKQTLFDTHAERMWYVNADSGIDAPTCVHGTGFFWGWVYEDACTDYNFMMIRQGNVNSNAGNGAMYAYFDPDTRAMIPYFIQGGFTSDSYLVDRIKGRIDYAISTKQALQIGMHAIKGSSYTPTQDDMYMGVEAVGAILAYVKQKVDAGLLVCCTTSEFVHKLAPDLYNAWNSTKSHSIT